MDLNLFLVLVPVFVNEGKFFSFSIGQKGDYQNSDGRALRQSEWSKLKAERKNHRDREPENCRVRDLAKTRARGSCS